MSGSEDWKCRAYSWQSRCMIEPGMDYMLFDGDCGICSYFAETAGHMRGRRRFVIEPYQSFPEADLARYGLDYDKCSRALQIITAQGKTHSGAFAVNYFLWHRFPWTLVVLLIYLLPFLLLFEITGYRLIASNRHRISGWLGLKACLLKQSDHHVGIGQS